MAVRSMPSESILIIALELASVGFMVLIAGSGRDAGNVMLLLMVGFWFLYLIRETKALTAFAEVFSSLSQNPSNS
jgi:hypothetical protein